MRRSYLELADGRQLHLREALPDPRQTGQADGPPPHPVVLLHQSPSSSAMWDAVLPVFGRLGARAVAFDLPGYGMSDPPPREPEVADYARDIAAGFDALGLHAVTLVGHHTGGSVGLQLAVDRPELVARLAIWGIGLLDEDFARQLATEQPPEYDDDATEIVRFWKAVRALATPEQRDVFSRRFLVEMLQSGYRRQYGHRAVGRSDKRPLLARLRQPLLGMAGPNEMLLEETKRAVKLASRAEYVEYVELPGAGIDVADSHPEEFAAAIDAFIRRTERAGPAPPTA